MMADLEKRIVNLENRRRNNCCEDGLKQLSNNATNSNAFYNPSKEVKSNILGFLTTSSGLKKRSTSQCRGFAVGSCLFQQPNTKNMFKDNVAWMLKQGSPARKRHCAAENVVTGIWALRSKAVDSGEKENETHVNTNMKLNWFSNEYEVAEIRNTVVVDEDYKSKIPNDFGSEDVVSCFVYDKFQKEVVNLRKSCEVEDSNLQAKDEEIKKFDGLTNAMEVELKKMKREAAARENEASSTKLDDKKKTRSTSTSKRHDYIKVRLGYPPTQLWFL
ncbi:microtubule-associated protein 70-5-like isoform X2 [Arachis duranensis]|uniref:Microtubule-associated protein 70-5-like isoform X2 n=1 Tax=Arachis duranensis TaxID=130453 RepID=A0A9C6T5N9_ARADU|nr:microtubule-associated protein 70-5-like isoform X2 [Arachis duranensis]